MQEFNASLISGFVKFLESIAAGSDKAFVLEQILDGYELIRDRSVYYNDDFALKVASVAKGSLGNTVLSLSTLLKYDDRPFLLLVVGKNGIELRLINTTFIKKISHSSQKLREDNIRGSFNGSDISFEYNGITNHPINFQELYSIHRQIRREDNIKRLVQATHGISAARSKIQFSSSDKQIILQSPTRAKSFLESIYFSELENKLNERVDQIQDEIIFASGIDNVNLRGRLIEELITLDDLSSLEKLIQDMYQRRMLSLDTDQKLADCDKDYDRFSVSIDIKTKKIGSNSAPKAFNIDKLLAYLTNPKSVYLNYIVGIPKSGPIQKSLVSIFQSKYLCNCLIQHHWAGRNSRGAIQISGSMIEEILETGAGEIDEIYAIETLNKWMDL